MYKCVGTLSKEYHASISNIMRPVKADSIPQLTKLGFASAQVDQFNPLGAVKLLKQIGSNSVGQSPQTNTPKIANWAMNRVALAAIDEQEARRERRKREGRRKKPPE